MKLKVRKVGNSLTVTIPKELAIDLGLKPRDDVEVVLDQNKLILTPSKTRWEKLLEKVSKAAREMEISEKDVMEAISEIRYGR